MRTLCYRIVKEGDITAFEVGYKIKNKFKYLSEGDNREDYNLLFNNGFDELVESTFGYIGSDEEAVTVLKEIGYVKYES